MAVQVDVHDEVPLLLGHVHEDPVPDDPGIVDEHMEVPKASMAAVTSGGHRPSSTRRRCWRLPLRHLLDLVHDPLSRRPVIARAVDCAPKVVDHDLGASPANKSACCRPIPRPAPVMIATLPSSAPMTVPFLGS